VSGALVEGRWDEGSKARMTNGDFRVMTIWSTRSRRAILGAMSLDEYVATQHRNLEAIKGSLHYSRLIETVDRLYRTTFDLIPAHCPRICFGKMLLMCHKSLLSAATLIARGQPEDAAPISRRAIEIGHLAVAVHLDSQNYVKWLDEERRITRHEERRKGQRPKNEPAQKWGKEVLEHPLLSDLRTFLGMISDSDAHFTPEFEGRLPWLDEAEPGDSLTILLEYFDTNKRTIHCAFLSLAAIHLKLLDVFNACFKDGLQRDGGWLLLKTTAWAIGGELASEFKPGEHGFSAPTP
jgi:hypothetical protein